MVADPALTALIAVVMPTFMAIIAHFVAKAPKVGSGLAKLLCVVTAYANVFLVLSLLSFVTAHGPLQVEYLAIRIMGEESLFGAYVDMLSLIPALFSSLFASLALTYNLEYMSSRNKAYKIGSGFNRSYSFLLIFMGSMTGAVFSNNLLEFLIFWEMISVCSYVLISFWSAEAKSITAAFKCILMTHVGTALFFIVTIVIFSVTGTFQLLDIQKRLPLDHPAVPLIILLLLLAFLPKTVQFPFHTWLPDGTIAPTSATVLFHVCGFQTGIYAFVRFSSHVLYPHIQNAPPNPLPSLFGGATVWGWIISLVGVFTLFVGALFGLIEDDFKRVIAYSTISQLGYIVMAIGLTSPLGVAAGLFHMISHALYCSLLFLCAGAVIYATGVHDINGLGGIHRYMPITTLSCIVAGLSLASMPLLSDFASKWLILHATIEGRAPLLTLLTFLGCALNTAIVVRFVQSVFMGEKKYGTSVKEVPIVMYGPMIFAACFLFAFGILPQIPLRRLVSPAIQQIGLESRPMIPPGFIITPVGYWNPVAIAFTALLISLILMGMLAYLSKKVASRPKISVEALKPFLSGEDVEVLDWPKAFHYYHVFSRILKVEKICALLDVDRLYNAVAGSFSEVCQKALKKLDIRDNYVLSVLWFLIGTLIMVLVAIFGG